MDELRTAYHEASHAVAAQSLGLPVTYLTIRPHEDHAGRTKFAADSEALGKLDALSCAVVKVAGEVGERMFRGATQGEANWFAEDEDAEDARPSSPRWTATN